VRPLAEVKGQAVSAWQAEQKREAATKQAEALTSAVNPGLPLAKAAGDKRLTLLPAAPLSRSAAPGQTVSPALVAKLFAAKPGDVVTASDDTGPIPRNSGRSSRRRRFRTQPLPGCRISLPARQGSASPAIHRSPAPALPGRDPARSPRPHVLKK